MNLGHTIKEQRINKGFNQKAFARLCNISQTYLSQLENNKREPNLSTLKVIGKELNVPLPILFFLSIDEEEIQNATKREIFKELAEPVKALIDDSLNKKCYVIKRRKHLEAILGHDYKELKKIADNVGKYYRPYTKTKKKADGSIKTREISPAIEPLKSIQKTIHKSILSQIPLPDYIIGGVKGKDNTTNALYHKGNKYKLCTDLSNFFPSISHKLVYQMLTREGFSADVAGIITKLTTFKGGVPQGASTSTDLANLVFLPIDKKIHNYCSKKGITYTRFVDDVTCSSQSDFKDDSLSILNIIHESPFKIHNGKTFYTQGKAMVTGILTGQNNISTPAAFKKKIESAKNDKSKEGMINYDNRVQKVDKKKRRRLFIVD